MKRLVSITILILFTALMSFSQINIIHARITANGDTLQDLIRVKKAIKLKHPCYTRYIFDDETIIERIIGMPGYEIPDRRFAMPRIDYERAAEWFAIFYDYLNFNNELQIITARKDTLIYGGGIEEHVIANSQALINKILANPHATITRVNNGERIYQFPWIN